MKLKNVKLCGNEKTGLAKDILYAQLVEDDGSMVISATLDYILATIRDQNLEVEGVTVDKHTARGSVVRLGRY